ncbi:uncharacterized protein N0V89_006411 [Didymosphaeria variabile]|uniref:Queuosine 5'-phosphate N-glycosylase/hydrolase n=1 Tax=Didymosphaeria variabile TaxID=1932322 RepID=A0A9W8XNJ2_9PLEO|nr:uncharacterized protein N0V89_006411 [Didymosphaeria variabile]KAJ4354674.1 hypothetical protein N0V89_006411 [Didymosphaeria variabile]
MFMSDDDVDHELLALLRQKFGLGGSNPNAPPETKVLRDAQFVYDNSIDVALSMAHTKLAAIAVSEEMQKRQYSTKTWAEHELHPKAKDEATVNFIFTMDLLNFSFWSEKSDEERFTVDYKGKKWTGYWSLVAALQRALDEGIPITSPEFWFDHEEDKEDAPSNATAALSKETSPPWKDPDAPRLPNNAFNTGVYPDPPSSQQPTTSQFNTTDPAEGGSLEPVPQTLSEESLDDNSSEDSTVSADFHDAQADQVETSEVVPEPSAPEETKPATSKRLGWSEDLLRHVFRSSTAEEIPMFSQRVQCLREAGRVLHEHFDGSVITLIEDAKGSAAGLVNLLADRFACFHDEAVFERKKVRFLKRAQIFVADLWAAFDGEGYGKFDDIDKITMFAGKFLVVRKKVEES